MLFHEYAVNTGFYGGNLHKKEFLKERSQKISTSVSGCVIRMYNVECEREVPAITNCFVREEGRYWTALRRTPRKVFQIFVRKTVCQSNLHMQLQNLFPFKPYKFTSAQNKITIFIDL